MFTGKDKSFMYTITEEDKDKAKYVMNLLYPYTNDFKLYATLAVNRFYKDILANQIVDKFVSQYETIKGEGLTITVTHDKTVFYIHLMDYPDKSSLSGLTYSVEY